MSAMENDLINVLTRLVDLKKYKDVYGKDKHYQKEQPELWRIARLLLVECEGKKQVDDTSKLNIGVVSNNEAFSEVAVCECSNPEGTPVNKIKGKWICCVCNRPLAN